MPCVETKIVINGDSKPIFEIIKNMEEIGRAHV